jgi:Polyketide cyclase / dehydrase and lipid transport
LRVLEQHYTIDVLAPIGSPAMAKVHVSTVINAPIERVWRLISDFNGLPAWMPGMKDSVIEDGKSPAQVGAVRRLSMAGSSDPLRERLEVFSSQDHQITYSVLQGPLPMRNIRTTMRLRPITDTYGTLGEWSSEFETQPGKEEEGVQFLSRVFMAGFRQMKRHLGV